MASIIQINGKWRAQVRRTGVPPTCKTFALYEDAEAWAAEEEKRADLQTSNVLGDAKKVSVPYQVAGVYMLFFGAELRYVGRSVHIYRRLNDHDRNHMEWDRYRILPCPNSIQAARLEQRLIAKHQPPLNTQIRVPRTKRGQSAP